MFPTGLFASGTFGAGFSLAATPLYLDAAFRATSSSYSLAKN
jgi:hypothetical protein